MSAAVDRAAALLHDAVEDQGGAPTLALIRERFGPRVAAIVDWEMCTIGDPLLDLGWLIATWPGEDSAELAGVIGAAGGRPLTEVDYLPILLWMIVAAVVASIVGRILAAIVWQGEGHETDVRDRDIDRRGEYIGGLVLGIGMVVPFILTVIEVDYFWIANAMYLVFVVASIVGTTIKLIVYRRGF